MSRWHSNNQSLQHTFHSLSMNFVCPSAVVSQYFSSDANADESREEQSDTYMFPKAVGHSVRAK